MSILCVVGSADIFENKFGVFQRTGNSTDMIVCGRRAANQLISDINGRLKKCYNIIIFDCPIDNDIAKHVIKRIRSVTDTPILFALSEKDPKFAAEIIDCGADMVIGKKFSSSELIARVNSLMTRSTRLNFKFCWAEIGRLRIDLRNRIVEVEGKTVHLTKAEYRLLSHLLINCGRIVKKSELIKYLNKSDLERADHLLNMHISNIRKKLGGIVEISSISKEGFYIKETK